ncbi:MAG: YgfZ/GcvT domain-containing protein [Gemmobacter sp.]
MRGETDPDRKVYRIAGNDRESFLQGLVTNDIARLKDGALYAALLTPQGKYLADFLLVPDGEGILLDIVAALAEPTVRRLMVYRLRADVQLAETDLAVTRGLGPPPPGAVADPRHPALGWRAYGAPGAAPQIDWDAIRVEHCIPESGIELVPNETYILEAGFERLNGVDFRKGCYVGQEVTARMKHKTDLRKGLVRVRIDGRVPVGTEIVAGDRPVGTIYTQSGGRGIAWLRFDRAGQQLSAAGVPVVPDAA